MQSLRRLKEFIESGQNVGLNSAQLLVLALIASAGWLVAQAILVLLFKVPVRWEALIGIVLSVFTFGFLGSLIVHKGPTRYGLQLLMVFFGVAFAGAGGSSAVVMLLGRALH